MPSSYSCLSKSAAIKLSIFILFVLVNATLYIISGQNVFDAILPSFSENKTLSVFQSAFSSTTNCSSSDTTNSSNNTYLKSFYQQVVHGNLKARPCLDEPSKMAPTTKQPIIDKPFLREPVVNPHNYSYVLRPNSSCSGRDIHLVICVPISNNNFEGRNVIRKTWGSYAIDTSNKALLVFFIGSSLKDLSLQERLSNESLIYGDILQEDYIDTYSNLTLKTVSILKWVSESCPQAKLIAKIDDDMYVSIPNLVKAMNERASDKSAPSAFILGFVQVGARPIRNSRSKWYTPVSLYKEDVYPNYVSGTAYAMTKEAVYLLYEASLRLPIFWLEDVYITGLCARKANVVVFNNGYFTYGKPSPSGCTFKNQISGHTYSHQEIIKIHNELYDPNTKC